MDVVCQEFADLCLCHGIIYPNIGAAERTWSRDDVGKTIAIEIGGSNPHSSRVAWIIGHKLKAGRVRGRQEATYVGTTRKIGACDNDRSDAGADHISADQICGRDKNTAQK